MSRPFVTAVLSFCFASFVSAVTRPSTACERAAVMIEPARTAEAAVPTGEERQVAGLHTRLQRVALGLGDRAGLHHGVDLVLDRLLQRRTQLRGRDAELARGVGDDRLLVRLRADQEEGPLRQPHNSKRITVA